MNLKSALRVWHRLVPRRPKSADQLAREDLPAPPALARRLLAGAAPSAPTGCRWEDARAVRREYKRLAAKHDTEALTKAINYAAALAPKERAPW